MQANINWENQSALFWSHFWDEFPTKERSGEGFKFTEEEWERVKRIPGFDSGPDHAPFALMPENW